MAKILKLNPIVKKEMLVSSRNAKMVTAITLMNCLFSVIIFAFVLVSKDTSFEVYYNNIAQLFPILASCELGIICLIIPILTATSISGERERQTLEIMLTTPISNTSVVYGKLLCAVVTTLMYVVSTLPFLAVSFIVGGLAWSMLLKYVGMVLFLDVYIGSIGVFYSCVKKTSATATVCSIITVVATTILLYAATQVIESIMYSYERVDSMYKLLHGLKTTCYVVNPVLWILVTMMVQLGFPLGFDSELGQLAYSDFLINHCQLICVSVNLVVSLILMKLGSDRLFLDAKRKTR